MAIVLNQVFLFLCFFKKTKQIFIGSINMNSNFHAVQVGSAPNRCWHVFLCTVHERTIRQSRDFGSLLFFFTSAMHVIETWIANPITTLNKRIREWTQVEENERETRGKGRHFQVSIYINQSELTIVTHWYYNETHRQTHRCQSMLRKHIWRMERNIGNKFEQTNQHCWQLKV